MDTVTNPTRPDVGDRVHYVSYGTPGGEYSSTCRAATVAEVGAWITVSTGAEEVDADGTRLRTVDQQWHPNACALVVTNPTGLFFNTAVHHPGQPDGLLQAMSYPGGTWHPSHPQAKTCTPIPCPPWESASLPVQPWVPTVDELRQAGGPVGQPDGTFYSLRDGQVVHVNPDLVISAPDPPRRPAPPPTTSPTTARSSSTCVCRNAPGASPPNTCRARSPSGG